MHLVTLSATFDGQFIQLDEPYPLTPGTRLLVTVLPPAPDSGPDEPGYTLADLNALNPLYRDVRPPDAQG